MGWLSDAQQKVVAEHVRGQRVHDYGAGDLDLSLRLLQLGAEHVVAVDDWVRPSSREYPPQLTVIESKFDDYAETSAVAFVSWPVNWPMGLHVLLERTPVVVYLGSNTNGNACGYPKMWQQLVAREVLAYVPHIRNTLIIYGAGKRRNNLLLEERGALDPGEVYFHVF
jgi:hypothetical protein